MPRRAKISREEILLSALALIDEDGVQGVSMRRLGHRLGVEAMSLYNHVRDKEAVLEGVIALLVQKVPIPKASDNWRRDVSSFARGWRRVLSEHPRAGVLFASREVLTEDSREHIAFILRALSQAIPQVLDRIYAFVAIENFLFGHLVAQTNSIQDESAHFLSTLDIPDAEDIANQYRNHSAELAFELGLDALLNAVERRSPF
jgi:TetR/AcrR family tetracycline transcriptional repressor